MRDSEVGHVPIHDSIRHRLCFLIRYLIRLGPLGEVVHDAEQVPIASSRLWERPQNVYGHPFARVTHVVLLQW